LQAYCAQIGHALPRVSVSNCQAQMLAPGGGRSIKGMSLLVRRIPAQAGGKGKPVRILLLGGIHGDEPTSSAVIFRWMAKMQAPAVRQVNWSIAPLPARPDHLGPCAVRPARIRRPGRSAQALWSVAL
jgi:hypothetical protein